MKEDAPILTDELVCAAVDGDASARQRLAEQLSSKVRLMVLARLCPSPSQYAVVDDLVQVSMSGFFDALPKLQVRTCAGARSFLSTIVARRVADFLRDGVRARKAAVHAVSLETTAGDLSVSAPLWQVLSASGTSPLSAADRIDCLQNVLGELGQLSERHREIITLAFFDQLATGEIADRLGVSRPAASMLLIRAIKALRRRVTGSSRLGDGRGDD